MGVKNAATLAGCTAVFENPSKEDVARQVTVMEGFVAQNVDGIVFGASDPGAFDKVVKDALDKNIPVITFDSDAPSSGRLVYIGPNNYHSGFLAGQAMIDQLGGKGKVAIQVGSLTALNAKERIQGFKDAIADSEIEDCGRRRGPGRRPGCECALRGDSVREPRPERFLRGSTLTTVRPRSVRCRPPASSPVRSKWSASTLWKRPSIS